MSFTSSFISVLFLSACLVWSPMSHGQSSSNSQTFSLGGLLNAVKEIDEQLQKTVSDQFPAEEKQDQQSEQKVEVSQTNEVQISEDEKLLGLWKSNDDCFVHFYKDYNGSLGGAAWGKHKESGQLDIEVAPERRFPWKRSTKKSSFGDDGEMDPNRQGRFIVDLYDSSILHSDVSPCFISKGSPPKWKRVNSDRIDVGSFPTWYQDVYGEVVAEIEANSERVLAEKRAKEEAARLKAEEEEAERIRKEKEAARLKAEKEEADRIRAEKAAELARQQGEQRKRTELVASIQSSLYELGFYAGTNSGELDDATRASLGKWAGTQGRESPKDVNLAIKEELEKAVTKERQRAGAEKALLVSHAQVLVEEVQGFLKENPTSKELLTLLKLTSALNTASANGSNGEITSALEELRSTLNEVDGYSEYRDKKERERIAEKERKRKEEEARILAEQKATLEKARLVRVNLQEWVVENLTDPNVATRVQQLEALSLAIDEEDFDQLTLLLEDLPIRFYGKSSNSSETVSDADATVEKSLITKALDNSREGCLSGDPIWLPEEDPEFGLNMLAYNSIYSEVITACVNSNVLNQAQLKLAKDTVSDIESVLICDGFFSREELPSKKAEALQLPDWLIAAPMLRSRLATIGLDYRDDKRMCKEALDHFLLFKTQFDQLKVLDRSRSE